MPLRNMAIDILAAVRVVKAHLGAAQKVTIGTARDQILHAAARLRAGLGGPSIESLATALQQATGSSIFDLAADAEKWPDN